MIDVYRDDFRALSFLASRSVFPDRRDFMGVVFVRDAAILGAAGVDAIYTGIGAFLAGHEATVHCAGSRCWTRPSIAAFFQWAFDELGFKRLTAQILECNAASLRLCEGLGFVREGVRRGAGPDGESLIMLGCLASERRY